jgi:glyoxylase-like metal-dependent hydrolase (beta-lactamase superfamily II)
MQEIANNVYIEDQYPGITLGAVCLPHGLIQIDAPPSIEDGRSWRASLIGLGGGSERVLISLDAHPDRTLGARSMECTTIVHEKTAQIFRNRPSMFKGQGDDTGSEWESIPNLGNLRWATPEIIFSHQMALEWGETSVQLEHKPGSRAGAIWVTLPGYKVVFVGDAIVKQQPPFIAHANLPAWIESLEDLLSDNFRGYTVVSGRGGTCASVTIRSQLDFLTEAQKEMDKLAARKASPEATEKLVAPLLAHFKFPASRQDQYEQRLRYGLRNCYSRNFNAAHKVEEE